MFQKLLFVKPQSLQINCGLLILRLSAAILMAPHGFNKLIHFSEKQTDFETFLGLNSGISLALAIGAEFFCSLMLGLGIFSRFSLIPLIITMLVAEFKAMDGAIFGKGELAFFYLIIYVVLLITGPGKFSIDNYLFKQKE